MNDAVHKLIKLGPSAVFVNKVVVSIDCLA